MRLQERIKERRLAMGMTLLDVANALGVQEATVQRYESGEIKNLKNHTVLALAKLFRCSPAYLMGWENDLPYNVMKIEEKKVPMLGKIRAGKPLTAYQENEYAYVNAELNADFCLRVNGDSMIGVGIKSGDIVYFRSQEKVDDGDIAAVVIDDEATLKRVYFGDNTITLVSENPKYKPMIFTPQQGKNIRILGKAVSYTAKL